MKLYHLGHWQEVARVFAAKVNGGVFTGLGSGNLSKPFQGTQVGITAPPGIPFITGRIIADNTATPIRRANGLFFTSEDDFFVNGSPVNVIRLEANIVDATANQNVARYQVVKYTEFGRISLATYEDIQTTMIAVCMEDLISNQTGTLCVQGVITNPDWNWQTVGAPLWVTGYGLLTETDPHVSDPLVHQVGKVPIARVLTQTSIFFDQGLGGKGDKGESALGGVVASDITIGITKLSLAAVVPTNPIAVGDNDLRMTNARTPLAHIHPISDVTNLQSTLNAKLNLAGGTMTGNLILHSDPTTSFEAATKQYVDSLLLGLFWQYPISDPDLKNDNLDSPPTGVGREVYIIGTTPTGAWTGLARHAVWWNGSAWIDIFNRPVAVGDRFGVGLEYAGIPSGGLTGQKNTIAQVTANTPGGLTYDFIPPLRGYAVLVDAQPSSHFGHQYTYNGTEWVELAGETSLDALTDVIVPAPTINDYLKFDGTYWINAPVVDPTITLSGAITGSGTTTINTTLTDVNTNIGTFGSATNVASVTVNSKGLITAVQDVAIVLPSVVYPYDIGSFYPDMPIASAIVCMHIFNRTVTFPANFAGSHGVAMIAAFAQTDFDIQKNGSNIGTMRFAASSTTATFILTSITSFVAGDILSVVAPLSPDFTLANITFLLAGTR